ncbi:hypothetical protein GCM10023185_26400 [Hymenobacter saemangeumensis]|uniref:VOC domain-containing protein n=1 Tax=Hymenobacter saemangeumensis TaxID=1084522 RepID=A0ABP8IJD2_9BACT
MQQLAAFTAHNGFDGVRLGHARAPYHLEFTHQPRHAAGRAPSLRPSAGVLPARARRVAAGGAAAPFYNPYWDQRGLTFEDPDGYRVVLQQAAWNR